MMSDKELTAMQSVLSTLDELDEDTKKRVIGWVVDRLGMPPRQGGAPIADRGAAALNPSAEPTEGFSSFAELFNAISPNTNAMKVLAAAY